MRIIFYTAVHDRYESFAAFLSNVKHIRRWVDIDLLVTITEGDQYAQKMLKNENYTEAPNTPLGKKWNAGLQAAKDLRWDYVFITGSDDLFSPALILHYCKLIHEEGYHYLGLLDFYFWSTGRNAIKYYSGHYKSEKGKPQGAGRMIHRSVVEACGWKLWNDGNNIALDRSMNKRFEGKLMKHKFISLKQTGFVAIDIKDGKNLHEVEEYKGSWVSDIRRDALLKAVGL